MNVQFDESSTLLGGQQQESPKPGEPSWQKALPAGVTEHALALDPARRDAAPAAVERAAERRRARRAAALAGGGVAVGLLPVAAHHGAPELAHVGGAVARERRRQVAAFPHLDGAGSGRGEERHRQRGDHHECHLRGSEITSFPVCMCSVVCSSLL